MPDKNGYKFVWGDEFDGMSLDADKWCYQTGTRDYYGSTVGANYWGNNEKQYYTEGDNLSVSDGELKITAKREDREGMQFTSSRIVTRGLRLFRGENEASRSKGDVAGVLASSAADGRNVVR